MPINMSKVHFPKTTNKDLKKSIDKKVALCVCNKSYIPQLGICGVITHKGIVSWCSFFVMPGNSPVLSWMLDCKD